MFVSLPREPRFRNSSRGSPTSSFPTTLFMASRTRLASGSSFWVFSVSFPSSSGVLSIVSSFSVLMPSLASPLPASPFLRSLSLSLPHESSLLQNRVGYGGFIRLSNYSVSETQYITLFGLCLIHTVLQTRDF